MVVWVVCSLAVVVTAQGEFFGQHFTGEQGSLLRIAKSGLTAEEAWKSHACDVSCGETCLAVATGQSLQACIGFCGCARFIEPAREAADVLNSLPEECPAACEALCSDKEGHCVEECRASFCMRLQAEGALSFYIGVALEAVGLMAILLLLRVCYGRMQSKRRRRMRLTQETEGTYSML